MELNHSRRTQQLRFWETLSILRNFCHNKPVRIHPKETNQINQSIYKITKALSSHDFVFQNQKVKIRNNNKISGIQSNYSWAFFFIDNNQCSKFARFHTALMESKNHKACLSSGEETLSDFCLGDTNVILKVNKQL